MYIHQHKAWPNFTWDEKALSRLLTDVRHKQGKIMGRMEGLGFSLSNTDDTLARVMRKAEFWENPATVSINDRQKVVLNKLLDGFDGKLNSSKWAKIGKCSQDSAGQDINNLIERGLLIKEDAGGRSSSYILPNS